jgi:hypothetical protein
MTSRRDYPLTSPSRALGPLVILTSLIGSIGREIELFLHPSTPDHSDKNLLRDLMRRTLTSEKSTISSHTYPMGRLILKITMPLSAQR